MCYCGCTAQPEAAKTAKEMTLMNNAKDETLEFLWAYRQSLRLLYQPP
jgi:hypothetical protein